MNANIQFAFMDSHCAIEPSLSLSSTLLEISLSSMINVNIYNVNSIEHSP